MIRLCLLVATFQTVVGQSLTGVSLPCQEAGRDPDEDNPMDNLSCPADGIDCFTASQLCDCVNATQNGSMSASSIFDSASFGIRSLNCSKSRSL